MAKATKNTKSIKTASRKRKGVHSKNASGVQGHSKSAGQSNSKIRTKKKSRGQGK